MLGAKKYGRAWADVVLLSVVLASAACSGDAEREDAGGGALDASAMSSTTSDDSGAQSNGDSGKEPDVQGRAESGSASANDGGAPSNEASAVRDAASADAAQPDAAQPDAGSLPPFEGEGTPWLGTAPRATCGATDKADGMLSGLNADLSCNLQIAGQVAAPHFLSLAWYKDCAYVNGPDGTTVIQVDATGKPSVTTTLTEVGFRSNWESMKANANSGLLAGYEANGTMLTVYDVSKDCKAPELQSTTSLEVGLFGSIGHAGSFSPDGTIYYASSMYTSDVFAVDLMNPKQPKVLTTAFDRGAHDLYVAKNGNRGYFANPDVTMGLGIGSFAVMDLSQIQARMPDAKGTLIHEIKWEDGNISQYPILLSYRGKDFLLINDELGSSSCDDAKKPQWGYTRIFDLSDEKSPKLVSLIKTEAQDPKNCMAAQQAFGSLDGFGLGTHYCNVDRVDDPRLLSCGNFDGGVRVYDIRNPWRPKEVAYFDTADVYVPSMQRIVVEKRELWAASTSGTFYVFKFVPGSAPDQILSQ